MKKLKLIMFFEGDPHVGIPHAHEWIEIHFESEWEKEIIPELKVALAGVFDADGLQTEEEYLADRKAEEEYFKQMAEEQQLRLKLEGE